MRVPYEWLREVVDIAAPPEEVADRLTMIGFEVEGAESVTGDTVYEVNVTPNRPDCLSIIGLARELSAIYNVPLKVPEHGISGEQPASEFTVEIVNPNLSNRYTGRVITGVAIAESPEWIRSRLEKCGIRSINNVVDITNYVLLEFGHPLHAFDSDTLRGKKIVVGAPDTMKGRGAQTKIKTLDGTDRGIPGDSLLIWDAHDPVAVAGVMGGANTEVTEKTKNIFLESAYFDPLSIRKTSKTLGLSSESSYRFERGTDIEFLEKALDRAALLISRTAGGTVHKIIDVYPVKYVAEPFEVRYARINRILGTDLSYPDMLAILKNLLVPAEDRGKTFVVHAPPHRRDLKGENDIAEEIARIYGFNNILTTAPGSPLSSKGVNRRTAHLRNIREAMRKAGFSEVVNYSFMNTASLDLLAIPEADTRRRAVSICNPLSQEQGFLRTTLAPSMVANLVYNLDRGMGDVRIFETARIFLSAGETLPKEELRLGGIFYRDRSPALWSEQAHPFYIVKGALESLFQEFKIRNIRFLPTGEPFLHRGQSSDIHIDDTRLGYLGVLAPEVVETLDLKKQKPEIVLFELNLDGLLPAIPETILYRAVPKYPSVERDIALVVDETLPAGSLEETIRSFPTDLIEDIAVFDFYKGKHIAEGKKSLAFNIIYRSGERTLTVEEVEQLHASLVEYLVGKTGGELRQ